MQLEILALRHQLTVCHRSAKRPRLQPADRVFWAWLSRVWSGWERVLVFVQPATVVRWRRRKFREHWGRLIRCGRPGRPPVSKEARELIRRKTVLSSGNLPVSVQPIAAAQKIRISGIFMRPPAS